ncbi:ABC transporter permease [Cognatishimia activa]|uniref:Transport permease protein n=1 Tax=Cognatishimia activa TaxID=1715691 RepID=A0A0N7MC92_9RHOB|nr:ABC transporter permease [Cognatishimia activa]CUJ17420.1 Polysialic acid transport protein KpsM [Cognatishimia activa]CUK27560.1 Polysialic acid transport protein KpsM [Cognatishimia activa]
MKQLRTQMRVIFALVLREARTRHGRARLGYAWAIIEPLAMITFLTLLFSQFRTSNGPDGNFALFFATGVLAFQAYRNTSVYICNSFAQNKNLFNYPMVKPIDAALARLFLDCATHVFVIALVLIGQIVLMDANPPHDIPYMAFAMSLLFFMALGAGLCLAVLRRFSQAVFSLYLIVMGPAFFLSCVFYSLATVPTGFREILKLNPLVHGVEGFRTGYYAVYPNDDVSLFYLFTWAVTLNFLGWIGERLTRFQNQ